MKITTRFVGKLNPTPTVDTRLIFRQVQIRVPTKDYNNHDVID